MGHISSLGLYKLGKECLKIRLKRKKMFQYLHFVFEKIAQQISCKISTNKVIQSFYQVLVDWLDLKKRWDSYQGNGFVICQLMVVIYKATRMAIIYFTQSAKEGKSFLLMQDFFTWLVLRYNLKVKII